MDRITEQKRQAGEYAASLITDGIIVGAGDWLILIFNLNPMTPIIKIYRQIIYYGQVPELGSLALALIIGIVFIVVGEVLFKKLQRGFAEEF